MSAPESRSVAGQVKGGPVLTQLGNTILVCAAIGLGGGFYKLYDSYVAFDQHKGEQTKLLEDRFRELDIRELDLVKGETQLTEARLQLDKEQMTAQEALARSDQQSRAASALENQLAPEIRKANAEAEIKKLMSEYAELGVDAGGQEPCDADTKKRYHQAKAIRAEMVGIAEANGLGDKYFRYLDSGVHAFSMDPDRCKSGTSGSDSAWTRHPIDVQQG